MSTKINQLVQGIQLKYFKKDGKQFCIYLELKTIENHPKFNRHLVPKYEPTLTESDENKRENFPRKHNLRENEDDNDYEGGLFDFENLEISIAGIFLNKYYEFSI